MSYSNILQPPNVNALKGLQNPSSPFSVAGSSTFLQNVSITGTLTSGSTKVNGTMSLSTNGSQTTIATIETVNDNAIYIVPPNGGGLENGFVTIANGINPDTEEINLSCTSNGVLTVGGSIVAGSNITVNDGFLSLKNANNQEVQLLCNSANALTISNGSIVCESITLSSGGQTGVLGISAGGQLTWNGAIVTTQ